MSERKVKVNGALTAFEFDKAKNYKYDSTGNLVEATTVSDNDIVIPGSKSSLRRIADLERNVSILATRLTTTDGGNNTDTGDVAYATKAGKWATARTISLSGDASGSVSFDGSANATLSVTVANDSHTHAFGNLTGKPTTLAGYGITDAAPDTAFVGVTVSNDTLTFTRDNGTTIAVTTSDVNSNNYLTGLSLSGTTLTATRTGLANVSVDLSGVNAGYATTSYVDTAINNLVDGAPAALNTLNELAAAIGDNSSYASSITTALAGKVAIGSNEYIKTATVSNDTITFTRGDNTTFSVTTSDANTVYAGWNLLTDGTSRSAITSAENVNFVGGTNVTLGYSATNNTITINSTDTNTTYSAGNGLSLSGTTFAMSGSFTGSFTATGDITAYSDDRLKTNVKTIEGALGKVAKVRGVTFDRIEDGSTSTGVVAQELAAVLPEAVKTDSNGMHHVAYGNITGLLIEAIKELKDEIDYLKGLK